MTIEAMDNVVLIAIGLFMVVVAIMALGANWIRFLSGSDSYDVEDRETPPVEKPSEPASRPAMDDGYRHVKCPYCNGKIG